MKNETEATVTVNGLRYRELISEIVWPELIDIDRDIYFQQDGVTCHTSNEALIFDGKIFRTVLFLEEMITIIHQDLVI